MDKTALRRIGRLACATVAAVACPPADGAIRVGVIATGLDNPRHVVAAPGASVYVALAGRGGQGACFEGPEGLSCTGASGAVVRVDRSGAVSPVITGLPSFARIDGHGAYGPHALALRGAAVFVAVGGPTSIDRDGLAARDPMAAGFGRIIRVEGGAVTPVADLWQFERQANPHGDPGDASSVDSNPVDIALNRGHPVVVDAGGNDLLGLGSGGTVNLLTVFPDRPVVVGGRTLSMQAVPTAVTRGPDGQLYVGQLTGYPFPVHGANVFRVSQDGQAEVFATGFTNIIDLAFDRYGQLYVLEFDSDSIGGPGADGSLWVIRPDGSRDELRLGPGVLEHPGGLVVGFDGSIFVTTHADEAGAGQVLRITGAVTAPAGAQLMTSRAARTSTSRPSTIRYPTKTPSPRRLKSASRKAIDA